MDSDIIDAQNSGVLSRKKRSDSPGLATKLYALIIRIISAILRWLGGVSASAIIISILFFIVINFYVFTSIVNLDSFFYSFLLLSLLTDGLYVFIHLPRSRPRNRQLSFDPAKVSVLIASYNGQDVIAETIRQAAKHVLLNQILVVSDASTDQTAKVAREMGVRVITNSKNMNKAFSVSIGIKHIKTDYVLLLDDDTLIGNTFIPTSLLDEGYSAVAFNVMPVKEKSLLNELQVFEYRQSMQLGKNIRAGTGAIGNISGAIGLFRTKDLKNQASLHSGQFAGEDEQRTLLVHLNSLGKGITYTDSTVYTRPPSTYLSLYRQRAYSWSAAMPELFTLYWQILLAPRFHYLLKAEKAYQMYIFLTDPLRLLFFWTLFTRSANLLVIFAFYFVLDTIIWFKLRRQDSFRAVFFYPIYSLALTVCRFISYFYWLYIKSKYLIKRLHHYAERRHLIAEYSIVFLVIIMAWAISARHFIGDINMSNKIKASKLEDISGNFTYETATAYGSSPNIPVAVAPENASYLLVAVERGDTQRAIAYKAIMDYLSQTNDLEALKASHEKAYSRLAGDIPNFDSSQPAQTVRVEKASVQQALDYERSNQ
ncbi:glycosyltransferase family 2 protein [Candidatus Saccharibacteria bacterium]|nr:glycosyltransferase family 2 protein [Candidatus Saccharibacteria bacterium]